MLGIFKASSSFIKLFLEYLFLYFARRHSVGIFKEDIQLSAASLKFFQSHIGANNNDI